MTIYFWIFVSQKHEDFFFSKCNKILPKSMILLFNAQTGHIVPDTTILLKARKKGF